MAINITGPEVGGYGEKFEVPYEVMSLLRRRQRARADKRWDEADDLRRQINEAGYRVEDTPHGSRLRIG